MPSTLVSCSLASPQRQDAVALVAIHYAAVHKTAAAFYDVDILDGWSPPLTPARIERFESMIANTSGVWLMIKQASQIAGFGVVVPSEQTLRGLYVHPTLGRRGLGTQLLHALESVALQQGVITLRVHASLNALRFYQQRGYCETAIHQHYLPSGQWMRCHELYKRLNC